MNPLGLFLRTYIPFIIMAYYECLSTRLKLLAERTCFSQVGAAGAVAAAGPPPAARWWAKRPFDDWVCSRGKKVLAFVYDCTSPRFHLSQ